MVFVNTRTPEDDGDAVIEGDLITEGKWKNRYLCHFLSDDSTAHVNPNRIYPVFPLPPSHPHHQEKLIFITSETFDYREMARTFVKKSHKVVEIGCSLGVCTARLYSKSSSTIGIDISKAMIDHCQSTYPHIPFYLLDVLADHEMFFQLASDCNALFIDVGGDRDQGVVQTILKTWLPKLPSVKLVVIKNRMLYSDIIAYKGTQTVQLLNGKKTWREYDGREKEANRLFWMKNVIENPQKWISMW